jgi:hypothetical protein
MRNLEPNVTSITFTVNAPAKTLTCAVVAGGVTYTKVKNDYMGNLGLFVNYTLPKYKEWAKS